MPPRGTHAHETQTPINTRFLIVPSIMHIDKDELRMTRHRRAQRALIGEAKILPKPYDAEARQIRLRLIAPRQTPTLHGRPRKTHRKLLDISARARFDLTGSAHRASHTSARLAAILDLLPITSPGFTPTHRPTTRDTGFGRQRGLVTTMTRRHDGCVPLIPTERPLGKCQDTLRLSEVRTID